MSYAQLTASAAALEPEYSDGAAEAWVGSPFAYIRTLPPPTKHAVAARLSQGLLQGVGVASQRVNKGLSIGNSRIAVKYSMEWAAGGFKFEQFKETEHNFILCLGVEPNAAYGWLIPKIEILVDGVWQEREGLSGQHRGQAAQDTSWLSVDPRNPPAWLAPYGGSIAQLDVVLANAF